MIATTAKDGGDFMYKGTMKKALKALANAPRAAAAAVLNDCKTPEERAEALRLFKALNIAPPDNPENNPKK